MKKENEENQKPNKTATARKPKAASNEDFLSELIAPQWSVVSFESCMASNLTYDEALKKIKQLQARKVPGLCIITDEAAERIKN